MLMEGGTQCQSAPASAASGLLVFSDEQSSIYGYIMNGLSFLVSPQMQDISQENARAQQDSYDRAVAGQQQMQQQSAMLERTDMMQRAAEARFYANEQMRLQMQANLFKQQGDIVEQRSNLLTERQNSLAEVAQTRKSLNDITSGGRKLLQDIAMNPSKYDPTWTKNFVPKFSQALANDETNVSTQLNSFLANHKPGDYPNIDLSSLQSTQMMDAPLMNPDVAEAMQARTANLNNLVDIRTQRYQLLKDKAAKSSLGAPEKKILDQSAYWAAQRSTTHQNYLDAIRAAGGNMNDGRVILAKQADDNAEGAFQGFDAELRGAINQGRIPQQFLTGGDSNTATQPSTNGTSSGASGYDSMTNSPYFQPYYNNAAPATGGQQQ